MFDSSFFEALGVISLIVEPDDHCNSHFIEDWNVVLRCEVCTLKCLDSYACNILWVIVGRTHGNKFSRDDPVEIAVLYFFIVLVLSNIELFEVKPA
jgi:hypothetical protein